MQELDLEIAQLLRKAEEADSTPLDDGMTIPEEVQRRQERKAQLAKARAEIEARARAGAAMERTEYERKLAARDEARAAGKKPLRKPPEPSKEEPSPKDQYNFTDPESRIMPLSGGGFGQAYNAQAAVEVESRLLVGQNVCTTTNDQPQLVSTFRAIVPAAGPVLEVLVDAGYPSQEAVRAIETQHDGSPSKVRVLAAMSREHHGRRVSDLEKKADPPPPAEDALWTEQMSWRVSTKAGRARYKLRQQTIEPIFGIIKAVMGFRSFRLRGLAGVRLEWTLATLAYNLRRLHRLGACLAAA